MATLSQGHEANSRFAATLQTAVARMQEAGEADIVALYPYDVDTDSFYAPVAIGLPEGDLVHALPDLADQLRRFRSDQVEGKAPDDLAPSQYGPSAWLLAKRKPLVSADARQEVDGSFIRRHRIRSIVGLPLQVGARIVALLYLNYVDREGKSTQVDVTDSSYMQKVEKIAGEIASDIDAAHHAAERSALQTLSELVEEVSVLPTRATEESTVARLEDVLRQVVQAVDLDAAALYVPELGASRIRLSAATGCPALAAQVHTLGAVTPANLAADDTVRDALLSDGLYPVSVLSAQRQTERALLLLAHHDPLVLERRVPAAKALLQTAADLLGSLLNNERLIEALGETNRTLGAVARLSRRLLQPGATQEQTLETAVATLTDGTLPELNFEFAAMYLLESSPTGGLAVCASAGATTSPAIDSVPVDQDGEGDNTRRMPRWVPRTVRTLDQRDVVAYVAKRRRTVVVAPPVIAEDDHFVTGYPEDLLERMTIQMLRADGSVSDNIRIARLREAADRAPMRSADEEKISYSPTSEITLDADIFSDFGHGSLVRVFVPFGLSSEDRRASGVLEAGFHVSRRQRLERTQIEALRACAATVAVAVETAHLYEDATQRAKQLKIATEVSRVIATSIDLEQTLGLIAQNMARAVDASLCLIALLEEDGSAWFGAGASDQEDLWRRRRMERPEHSIVFEVVDHGRPIVVEDAQQTDLVSPYVSRLFGIRSLVALPLRAGEGVIGAVILAQRDRKRVFEAEEVERASGLADQAAMAIRNARLHARTEEEHHIQKDVVLVGFGQWGQKAYKHLVLLKNFFNFRTHVVEFDRPGRRAELATAEQTVLENGDLFYWDSPSSPARTALALELEPSCYVITYIATPAETHLPVLKVYYDLSNVVLIEKPLGAPPEVYRKFLEQTDGSVQIIAADHYWFKLEVRLLELLLTEERNLHAFLDEIEEVELEILEEQPPTGSGAQIGMIADLVPHAFAVLSLLTPLDHIHWDANLPLQIGRYQPLMSERETYARLVGSFEHRGRRVRVTIDVGKGLTNAKWIKLSGPRRMGGRRPFYKFDFNRGEAIDGTQSALRAANRPIRQPGVPDNAHLSMLRHVIEKKHPAVGILSIYEALRANARIQELESMAGSLLASGQWTPYEQGHRPIFTDDQLLRLDSVARDETQAAIAQ